MKAKRMKEKGKGKAESGGVFAKSGGVFAKSGGDFTDGVPPSDRQLFKTTDGETPSDPHLFKTRERKNGGVASPPPIFSKTGGFPLFSPNFSREGKREIIKYSDLLTPDS